MKEPLLISVQNKLIFQYSPGRMQVDSQFSLKNISSDLVEVKIELSNSENFIANPQQFYLRSQEIVLVNIKQRNYRSININERAKIMYRTISKIHSAQTYNYQIVYTLFRYLFFESLEQGNQTQEPDILTQKMVAQIQNNRQSDSSVSSNNIWNEIHYFTIIICALIAIFALLHQLYTKIVHNDI